MFNRPGLPSQGGDPRTPDIIVLPNVGVVYTGSAKKQAEHGGFALDDTNVMLLVANPALRARTITSFVETSPGRAHHPAGAGPGSAGAGCGPRRGHAGAARPRGRGGLALRKPKTAADPLRGPPPGLSGPRPAAGAFDPTLKPALRRAAYRTALSAPGPPWRSECDSHECARVLQETPRRRRARRGHDRSPGERAVPGGREPRERQPRRADGAGDGLAAGGAGRRPAGFLRDGAALRPGRGEHRRGHQGDAGLQLRRRRG